MYNYVIFDFDGTLVDTGEGILKSLQFAFEDHGQPVPEKDDLRKFIGPPIFYSFNTFYKIPAEEVGSYIKSYRKRYREKGIYESVLYDGMLDTLLELKKRGIKIGIASSKPESLIFDVSKYLKIYDLFDAISGTKMDDSNHATKIDLVQIAIDDLGATDKLSEVLMVGDRLYDIEGANGCHVDSCGVLFGYGEKEELEEYGATYIVEKPKDILNLV